MSNVGKPPRTLRGWAITVGVDFLGFVVLALIFRIWETWTDSLTWAGVAIGIWVGADLIDDLRRRRGQAA